MNSIPRLDKKGYRNFAFTMAAVFAVVFGGFLPWLFDFPYPLWPWWLFLILAVWGLAAPESLRYVYVGWMSFALLINKITAPIILGIVFYLVVTPFAIVRRGLRKDSIPKEFDDSKTSYRLKSDEASRDNFERPF